MHVIQNKKMRWPLLLSQWDPGVKLDDDTFPYRKPGRPFLRWDDSLHDYCCYEWSLSHWTEMMNWEMQRAFDHFLLVYSIRVSFFFFSMRLRRPVPSCGPVLA